jgi:arylsulfatase A-like enzyme
MVSMNSLLSQNRKTNRWSLAALVVVAILTGRQFVAAENPPNVVVILVDDLGYGDLGSYGATDLKSPHIDTLVSRGMKFSNFYANCPVCSPTRASLLTGRYPELVGVPGVIRTFADQNWGELSSDAVLLPDMLESAGYDSAIVGKWHLGLENPNRPTDRGFDFFHGYLGDMMDDYYKHRRHGINYMRKGTREIDPQGHATDLFTDWACDYLRGRTQKKAPFFLYLAYNAPHTPIQPPDDWVEKVLQRETGIDPARARLVALIEHMDDGIGKVMETILKTGLAANTLVIFTSDNGGQLSVKANNGPLRDGKQSMYEGGLKVPACAVWPEKIAPGSHSDRNAITMDLFATICDVAGVSVKHTIEGRSILPTLLGQSQPAEDRDLFFHRREGGERYGGLTTHAIRRGEWKLLQNSPFAPMELYNLRQDPAEQNDLANTNRKVYRELLSALRVQIQRGGAVPWQRPARRDVK